MRFSLGTAGDGLSLGLISGTKQSNRVSLSEKQVRFPLGSQEGVSRGGCRVRPGFRARFKPQVPHLSFGNHVYLVELGPWGRWCLGRA